MGSVTLNGWASMDYTSASLTSGDNSPAASEYLVLIPASDGDRVVSFVPPDSTLNWMMEVANGDTSGTKSVDLIAGIPAQTPPQIFVPGGNSKVTLAPGRTQRMAYIVGTGWVALFNGVLVP